MEAQLTCAMKGSKGLKLCGERLEEIQDLLSELSELLDDEEDYDTETGVSDQTMEVMWRDLAELQGRIGGRPEPEEVTELVDELGSTVKALGAVIMLLGLGGALALSCWDRGSSGSVVDES